MANIEKELLKELHRFREIGYNLDNLNEQQMIGGGSGFIDDQGEGGSDSLQKFNKRQEMGEQEEVELELDPDAEAEDLEGGEEGIEDEMAVEDDMGDEEADIEGVEDEIGLEDSMGGIEGEDTTELDVTDLVTKQDEVTSELSDQKDILSKNSESLTDLISKLSDLETHLTSMDDMVSKIDSLETKIDEYRPKTEEEKLGLRKYDSGPFNSTLSDFFTDKEEEFDKTGKKQYILTPEEAEAYNEDDISKSFNSTSEDE